MQPIAPGFPAGFVWGAATAAYQVEGALDEDGRGVSIWDTFTATPGAIARGDTAAVACDHYHRHPEDIALLADLGLSAYRFSVAWPRIQPDGVGGPNQKGLDHYRRVVDACLGRGVTPYVTLYHWDLPQALEDVGGWLNRDTAHRFADYAAQVADALGDVVDHWVTVNEPKVASHAGYAAGIHAPGIRDPRGGVAAAHHLLLAHGLAVPVLRERMSADGELGIALDLTPVSPASQDPADVAAARRFDGNFNRMFLEPVLRGRYPTDMIEWFGGAPWLQDGDLEVISAPIDFLGINYYRGHVIGAGDGSVLEGSGTPMDLDAVHVIPPDAELTEVGWTVTPTGLHDLLLQLRDEYPHVPLMVTENGAAYPDVVAADGTVDDPKRVAYLDSHVRQMHRAIADGVDLRGYFVWTLLDNFEWAEGYKARFGIVHVDVETQRRTPKTSAAWLGAVARSNRLPDGGSLR
ncbi:GH1 family beta-glucosidase [Cellulomonas sp. KRMCY2]|uniref:GH1 family beta-glucosidase n=1 Tax=Cellulomonas sp. KRMCY2 TaxID=1304865 RepID=UPI00045EC534|nr:GH1 family beta-glucosidase [Cellulomonas sp. KRMCY2]